MARPCSINIRLGVRNFFAKQNCTTSETGTGKTRGFELDPQRNHHHHHLQPSQEVSLPHQVLYARLDNTQQTALAANSQHQIQPQQAKKRSYLQPTSSQGQNTEHASFRQRMGETYHQRSSRLGLGSGGGKIVEVQGGHIVRSTGRKDRHSKVCTAKGPRDRRVRLSANTAIEFYDVQDRLGYDRPSKAVDWLIKKAKTAIDELAELPAWKPTTGSIANVNFEQQQTQKQHENSEENSHHNQYQQLSIHHSDVLDTMAGPSSKRALMMLGGEGEGEVQGLHQISPTPNPTGTSSSFLPPSMDSDSIADTIKSFFPMGASTEANTSAMQFQSFAPPDLMSRPSRHSQDLRLSLQSFQDPMLLHHHHSQQAQHHNQTSHTDQEQQAAFFSGTTPVQLGFDGSGWSDHHQQDFQRLTSWNVGGGDTSTTSGGAVAATTGGGGYAYNSAPGPSLLQPFFGQNQFFSQGRPLQSSNTPSVRAWMDPSAIAVNTTDHSDQHHQHYQAMLLNYQSSMSGFASGVGGFSGFRIPSRIQGDEEELDGISDKPSSASSDSRH